MKPGGRFCRPIRPRPFGQLALTSLENPPLPVLAPAHTYTLSMANPPTAEAHQVGLLVLEFDPSNAGALKQILDSEGWRVRLVPDVQMLHAELKTGEYALVIANIELVGLDTPTFQVLRELASVAVEDGGRMRVLFVVPELAGGQFVPALERARVPYAVRPFHLHDFFEKVSDLLVEVKAIEGPLRMTRYEFGEARKKKKLASRTTSMFASRDSYSYSEEELAEYERQEAEDTKNRRIKPRTNLGDPRS
jgi:DNA-binding response OmpR family regulator